MTDAENAQLDLILGECNGECGVVCSGSTMWDHFSADCRRHDLACGVLEVIRERDELRERLERARQLVSRIVGRDQHGRPIRQDIVMNWRSVQISPADEELAMDVVRDGTTPTHGEEK